MTRRFLAGSIALACLSAQAEPVNPRIVERYKQLLTANPGEGTALDRLWKIYSDQQQTAELIAEYRAGGTFATELVLGHLLRKVGRGSDAQAAFERAALLDTGSARPWLALAALHLEQSRPREAAEAYEQALTKLPAGDPQIADVLMQTGAAWMAAEEPGKAAAAWEHTITLDPTNLDLRRRLAEASLRHQLPARAIVHLEYLEKHGSPQERAQAAQQLAKIHQAEGAQDAAIAALDRALAATAPDNWLRTELQSQLIRLHQRYRRVPELEQRWQTYVRKHPRDLAAYLQLIDLYERIGDLERQREWLERLVNLAPKTPAYELKLARLLVQLNRASDAAAHYDRLLAEQPANADLVFERARLDVQSGDLPAAHARIRELLRAPTADEALRGRARDFYAEHRLHDLLETQLREEAAAGEEEPLLALARFLYAQKRDAEAREIVNGLVPKDATPDQQSAGLLKKAQILRAQQELPAAAEALREIVERTGGNREVFLLLGEIQSALGQSAEARAAFEKALAASRTPQEAIESDQKIFESLRGEAAMPRTSAAASAGLRESNEPNAEVQSYLLRLTSGAVSAPGVDAWLRVARWHFWARNFRGALEYARKALALDPESVPTHEFIVKVASVGPQMELALEHLATLVGLDPERADEHRHRAGQLKMQAGQVGDALRIFLELTRAQPTNLEALNDLALAQQRIGEWEQALKTWQQVLALTPPTRQQEVITSLLRAYEQLGRHQPAAELLLRQIDARLDEKNRFAALQELLDFAAKHELLGWLRDEFEKRRRERAEDFFTEIALGRTLRLLGNEAAALEVLADASYAAPNPAEVLPELVREAEENRSFEKAAELQSQLLRLAPPATPGPLLKLAQLQEATFDFGATRATWDEALQKFPRDAAVFRQAVEFATRWADTDFAAELLRLLIALEPGDVPALARLARLHLEAGAIAEAQKCFEQILAQTSPERPGSPLRIPGVVPESQGTAQSSYLLAVRSRHGRAASDVLRAMRQFWSSQQQTARGESELRLQAIADLGKLLQMQRDPAQHEAWIESWRDAQATPTEALWALHAAGAGGPLLDLVEKLRAEKPDDSQLQQAFIWLALQHAEYARLGSWLRANERTTTERDFFQVALGQLLQSRPGKLDPALLGELFPPDYRVRLWPAAVLFARHGYLREALTLGERVWQSLPNQRAGYGLELAHWHLFLGEMDPARNVLGASLTAPASSYDAPYFAALREAYLLLPETERPAFLERFSAPWDPSAAPSLHQVMTRALLAGLSGEMDGARAEIQRLPSLGALAPREAEEENNTAARYWDFILTTGMQLQNWKLDPLAVALWEAALSDQALIRLSSQTQGELVLTRTREVRVRLAAARLLRARPAEVSEILAEHEQQAGSETLGQVAEALESLGALWQAIAVHHEAWNREPASPHTLRDLMTACRMASDFETLEQVLARCVREKLFSSSESMQRDLAVQLADLLDRRGASAQAQAVLDDEIGDAPSDARLLEKLAQLHERAGRLTAAEGAYRRLAQLEPANIVFRLALAGVLQRQNRAGEAIELLAKSTGAEADSRLASLYLELGRFQEALAALNRLTGTAQATTALAIADALAKTDHRRQAQIALRTAIFRNPEAPATFPLQARLIELLDPVTDQASVLRETARLRTLAGEQDEALAKYYDLMLRETPRLRREAHFASELAEDWSDGAGHPIAGIALLRKTLNARDVAAVDTLWAQLSAREDLSESQWIRISEALENSERKDLAADAHGRLVRLAPANGSRLLDWARALQRVGRKTEARGVIDEVAARAVSNEDLAGAAAKLYSDLGAPDVAQTLYAQAVANDPAGKNFRMRMEFARLLLTHGQAGAAHQHLRGAFQNPANREFAELVELLDEAGRLQDIDQEIASIGLRPHAFAAVHRAHFVHLEKRSRVQDALTVLEAHPEIAEADFGARIRALAATTQAFEETAATLELLAALPPPQPVAWEQELQRLYEEWTASEAGASR